MDWTIDQINQCDLLEAVELGAIQLRKKSTHYSAYVRVSFDDYRKASHARKKELIEFVTGDEDAYPGDYMARDLVNQVWNRMAQRKKNAWKRRANFLNSLPVVGEFRALPRVLIGHVDRVTRNCIQEECDLFCLTMRRSFLQKNTTNAEKKQSFLFPQKVTVGRKLSKLIPFSPLFRYVLFGTHMSKVMPWENFSINAKFQPGYAHLASPSTVRRLMTIEDVSLMTHHSYEMNCDFVLTSIGSLVIDADAGCEGRAITCYGWSETREQVTFIYNPNNEGDQSHFITFPRPRLITEQVVHPVTGRRTKKRKYEIETAENGYILNAYTPVCMRIHYRSLNTFRFVGARLAYRTSEDGQSVYIISSFSSS